MHARSLVACLFLASLLSACKDGVVGPSPTTTTRGANGVAVGSDDSKPSKTPTAAPVGDELDPQFSANLAVLAQLMGLTPAQLGVLRHTMEQNPEIVAQIRRALLQLSEANKELLNKLAKEFVPLADAQILLAKIRFLTGLTNEQGDTLKSIAFVNPQNEDITEQIIGKGLPTSLRLLATYEGSGFTRDVTHLAKLVMTGDGVAAKGESRYLVVGTDVDKSVVVKGSLGEATATIKLTVKDGSVTYSATLFNEYDKTAINTTLPAGMIGSMRVLAELKSFEGTTLSISDVSESATFSANVDSVAFLQKENRFLRKSLFAASTEGAIQLKAQFTFNGKSGEVVKALTITPAVSLYAVFDGPFSKGFYPTPEGIHCFGAPADETYPDVPNTFFLGDVVSPFKFNLFNSLCAPVDKTTDAGLTLKPENAMVLEGANWIAKSEAKQANGKADMQKISGSYSQVALGGGKVFASKNVLEVNIREKLIAFVISDKAGDRPIQTCPSNAAGPGALPASSSGYVSLFVWMVRGDDNCLVDPVQFGGADPDLIHLSLSVPPGATYKIEEIAELLTGAQGNVIRIIPSQRTDPVDVVVTGTYDVTSQCKNFDTVCLESANSKVSATIRIPAFSGGGNQPPGPGIRTYDRDVKPIMSANCATGGCHVGGSSGKSADLTTYTNVKTRIVSILSMVTSGYMPPGAPLRASDIQTINDWNAAGLLESDMRGSLKLAADSRIGRLIWEFSIAKGTGSSAWNSFSMPAELFVGEVLRIRALEGRHGFHTQSKPCPHGGNRQYDANGNQLMFNAVAEIPVNGYFECDIASTIDTTVGGLPQVYDHIQGANGLFFLKATTP